MLQDEMILGGDRIRPQASKWKAWDIILGDGLVEYYLSIENSLHPHYSKRHWFFLKKETFVEIITYVNQR